MWAARGVLRAVLYESDKGAPCGSDTVRSLAIEGKIHTCRPLWGVRPESRASAARTAEAGELSAGCLFGVPGGGEEPLPDAFEESADIGDGCVGGSGEDGRCRFGKVFR
jgi:hypothetical protein